MYIDNNNHFYGKIGDKKINDFLKFNFNLNSCEERIAHINKVLGMYLVDGVEFYDEYFDVVYDQERKYGKIDIVINTATSQYSESNVARVLESIANYILAVDEKDRSINYKIYTSEELFNRACQEFNTVNSLVKANGGLSMASNSNFDEGMADGTKGQAEAFPFFQLPKNYKKVKDLKIEKGDFERFPEMKMYNDTYEYLKEKFKKLWSKGKLTKDEIKLRGMIKKVLPALKKDITDVKKELQQPIIWKAPLSDSGHPSWDELDMFDYKTVRELLRVHKGDDLQNDLTCIVQDLDNLIKKIKLNKKQQNVLELWQKGNTMEDISKELKITYRTTERALESIVKKIINKYEDEYTNWYYLNICKGKYKKCSRCGEIKLIREFNIDKSKKDGYRNRCKKCDKK